MFAHKNISRPKQCKTNYFFWTQERVPGPQWLRMLFLLLGFSCQIFNVLFLFHFATYRNIHSFGYLSVKIFTVFALCRIFKLSAN